MKYYNNHGIEKVNCRVENGRRVLVTYDLFRDLDGINLFDYVKRFLPRSGEIELKTRMKFNNLIGEYEADLILQQFIFIVDNGFWSYKDNYIKFADDKIGGAAAERQSKFYNTVLGCINLDMVIVLNKVLQADKII